MKRVIGLVFICGAASCVSVIAAPVAAPSEPITIAANPKVAAPKLTASELAKRAAAREAARRAAMMLLAPADEYFGPLKLSLIGMQNSIRDLGRRYDVNHDISKQTFASAQLVERSIRDWAKKYSKDDQLPRVVYGLQRLYTKVLSQESRDRAGVIASWLRHDFARSPQAKQLVKTLALEHLAPIPQPTATPAPTPLAGPYQSIFGPAYPSEFGPAQAPPSVPPTASPAIAPRPSSVPTSMPAPLPSSLPAPVPTSSATSTPTSTVAPTPRP